MSLPAPPKRTAGNGTKSFESLLPKKLPASPKGETGNLPLAPQIDTTARKVRGGCILGQGVAFLSENYVVF